MTYGLNEKELKIIIEKIMNRPKIKKAVIFGSRAKGNYKKGSDIDIALYGNDMENEIMMLARELNEHTNLPYFIDVLDYDEIDNPELKNHIDKFGKIIFEKTQDERS